MKIAGLGNGIVRQKAWSWSYSKLKNYESCPRKHYEVDIAKTAAETQSSDPNSPLEWGKRAHDALAAALTAAVNPLPSEFSAFQHWVQRVVNGPGELLVEQKYAINDQFEPRGWFDKDVWCRMIGDVVKIDEPFTTKKGKTYRLALVLDWKTGKILDDHVQLMLMAQALFSHYPDLTHVRSEFVWLKDECTTPELFTREEVAREWVELMPRVLAMQVAHLTQNYPPKPSGLCQRYCPVKSCPYWGKGA